jgi:glycine oxidase
MTMRILIKGAGVAGLTVAWQLYRHGFDVTITERAEKVGLGASGFAGGMLAPWCERESAEEPVLALGCSAADWWEAAVPGHVTRRGTLVVAAGRDAGELDRFARRTSGWEWLDGAAIAELEPDLAGRFPKALFFRQEAHLDPQRALSALTAGLEEARMRFLFNAAGTMDASRYDRVIDCTGAARIGELPDLRGVRGEMLYVETPSAPPDLRRTTRKEPVHGGRDHDRKCRRRRHNRTLAHGTAECRLYPAPGFR